MPGVAGFLSGHSVFNGPFSRLLVQLLLITALSRAIGKVFTFIKEPMVISEIVAGIILGPTVLGNWEWFTDNFFPSSSLSLLTAVANLGLVLFMFLVGCEIDMKLLKPRLKISLATGAMGTAVCFAVAAPLAVMIRHFDCDDGGTNDNGCAADLLSGSVSFVAFYLFLGVIVSISALPVLARILTDFRILTSKIGVLTIATTTIEDFFAWPLLAISLAIAGATKKITILYLFLLLLGDLLLVGVIIRPLLVLVVRYYVRRDAVSHMALFFVMSLLILVAFYAEIIGLSAFIGAFQVGLVMPRKGNFIGQISSKIEDITVVLLLPLFFASSGQKTNLKEINTGLLWAITVTIIVTSSAGKILGCVPPAKWLAGFSLRESFTFGVLMNTKGLVALVSLNLGLCTYLHFVLFDVCKAYGIITIKLFSMLVLMVIINTLLTCPVVWVLNRVFFRERSENEKQAARERAAERRLEKRTAMLCLQPALLSESLAVARLIFAPDTQWVLLRILETADRPSTYMGPLQKKMIKRDQILRSALEFTKIIEIPAPEVLCDVAANFFHGVRIAAGERDPNILFLTVDRNTATAEQTIRDLEPLTKRHTYTLIVLIDQRSRPKRDGSGGDLVSDRSAQSHGLSVKPINPLVGLRGERTSVVFPCVAGVDAEEALTLAIQLSNRGVAVEVIQTAAAGGNEANEVLRRLFSRQSVSYRVHLGDWREALGADADRPGRVVLLHYSRETVAFATTASMPVLLVKASSQAADRRADDASASSIAIERPPSRSSNLAEPV